MVSLNAEPQIERELEGAEEVILMVNEKFDEFDD